MTRESWKYCAASLLFDDLTRLCGNVRTHFVYCRVSLFGKQYDHQCNRCSTVRISWWVNSLRQIKQLHTYFVHLFDVLAPQYTKDACRWQMVLQAWFQLFTVCAENIGIGMLSIQVYQHWIDVISGRIFRKIDMPKAQSLFDLRKPLIDCRL